MNIITISGLQPGMVVRPVALEAGAFVDRIVVAVKHDPDGTGVVRFSRPHATIPMPANGFTDHGYSRCEEWDDAYSEWAGKVEQYRLLTTLW